MTKQKGGKATADEPKEQQLEGGIEEKPSWNHYPMAEQIFVDVHIDILYIGGLFFNCL